MPKTEAQKKEHRKQKREQEEKASSESPGASSAKKTTIQSSSPVPEVVAPTPSQQAAVVEKSPSRSQKAIKLKIVSFEYGYPVEGVPYRPEDEFSDDDDGPAIATKKQEMRDIEERHRWVGSFRLGGPRRKRPGPRLGLRLGLRLALRARHLLG